MKRIIGQTSPKIFSSPCLGLLAATGMLWLSTINLQAVPGIINYQGKISEDGVIFDGTGQFKFALVNAAGDVTNWSNDGTSVTGSEPTTFVSLDVFNGNFSVGLGDTSLTGMPEPITPDTFSANDDVYLRVWFRPATDPGIFQQLIPDLRISSEGFAFAAAHADFAITADFATTAGEAGTLNGMDSSEFLIRADEDVTPDNGIIDLADFATNAGNADSATNADNAELLDGLDSADFILRNDVDPSPSNGIIDIAEFAFNADVAVIAGDANTLDGFDSADFIFRNDVDPTPGNGIVDQADFAFEADHAITADFATTAGEAGTLNGFDSSEFLIRADEDASPDNGIIDLADFASDAGNATTAGSASNADNADLLNGMDSSEFLIRADEDVTPGNGIIDQADFAFEADHAITADFAATAGEAGTLGGLFSRDYLEKSIYDPDLDGSVVLADFAVTAGEAGTLNGFNSADFILRNDVDPTPGNGIVDLADFATDAGNATTADFATDAGNATTADNADLLDGFESADFIFRNEVDPTPGNGIVDLADFATVAGDADLLEGQPSSAFSLDGHGHDAGTDLTGTLEDSLLSGEYNGVLNFSNSSNSFSGNGSSLTDLDASSLSGGEVDDSFLSANVAFQDGNNDFSASNSFSGADLSLGSDTPFNLFRPPHGSLDGTSLIISGQNAHNDGSTDRLGGDLTLRSGLGANAGQNGLIFLEGDTDILGGLVVSGTIIGTVDGDGSGLTDLNADNLSGGTVDDSVLSANVALQSADNDFFGNNTFSGMGLGLGDDAPFSIQRPGHTTGAGTELLIGGLDAAAVIVGD